MSDIDVTQVRLTIPQMFGVMFVFGGIVAVNAVNVYKVDQLTAKVDNLPPKYLIDAVNENRKNINKLKDDFDNHKKEAK